MKKEKEVLVHAFIYQMKSGKNLVGFLAKIDLATILMSFSNF